MRRLAERMMALALAQARKGWGWTSPNPMVGAVVAQGERVISKGYHARAGGPHAEVVALERAGEAARGATLYVTLEPCHHYGRTPPCTLAILKAGVSRVVAGHRDPNPQVTGGGADFLRGQGIEVELGVLENRCLALNEFYLKFVTTGRPFVLLKSAATLDGKTATRTGQSRWVTGEEARRFVHYLRSGVDAVLVGRGTVEKDDPALNVRLPGRRKNRDPLRVVLDTNLSLPISRRVFDRSEGGPTIVACGPSPAEGKIKSLQEAGIEVWPLPLRNRQVSLAALMEGLGRKQITSLLIEGGAEVNASALLEEKVVDKVMFFYAPKVVGGRTAPSLVGGAGVEAMDEALPFETVKVRRLGRDILVEAVPRYQRQPESGEDICLRA